MFRASSMARVRYKFPCGPLALVAYFCCARPRVNIFDSLYRMRKKGHRRPNRNQNPYSLV